MGTYADGWNSWNAQYNQFTTATGPQLVVFSGKWDSKVETFELMEYELAGDVAQALSEMRASNLRQTPIIQRTELEKVVSAMDVDYRPSSFGMEHITIVPDTNVMISCLALVDALVKFIYSGNISMSILLPGIVMAELDGLRKDSSRSCQENAQEANKWAASELMKRGAATPSFTLEDTKPYAELWMGTHQSCPSIVASSGGDLRDFLIANPNLLGHKVIDRFGNDLPFLFKVLAINKALSIQAHPDKALAKKLHLSRPEVYKDSNHKPEMAIAITSFTGFCGFLPSVEIASYLSIVPELRYLVGEEGISQFAAAVGGEGSSAPEALQSALRSVFAAVMNSSEEVVRDKLTELVSRYNSGDIHSDEGRIRDILLTLSDQYPGDVGIFCSFLLNIVRLGPGQAIFLKANEPHAYISGDIVETMATSDNVVRAGLTPKLRDIPTLLSMLTYFTTSPSNLLMEKVPYKGSRHTILYDPPIDEFAVLVTELEAGEEEEHPAIHGPSIFIVTKSGGSFDWNNELESHHFKRDGEVFFIGAGTSIKFKASGPLVLYRAFIEVI